MCKMNCTPILFKIWLCCKQIAVNKDLSQATAAAQKPRWNATVRVVFHKAEFSALNDIFLLSFDVRSPPIGL